MEYGNRIPFPTSPSIQVRKEIRNLRGEKDKTGGCTCTTHPRTWVFLLG